MPGTGYNRNRVAYPTVTYTLLGITVLIFTPNAERDAAGKRLPCHAWHEENSLVAQGQFSG
jgi:hypothetical protein